MQCGVLAVCLPCACRVLAMRLRCACHALADRTPTGLRAAVSPLVVRSTSTITSATCATAPRSAGRSGLALKVGATRRAERRLPAHPSTGPPATRGRRRPRPGADRRAGQNRDPELIRGRLKLMVALAEEPIKFEVPDNGFVFRPPPSTFVFLPPPQWGDWI